jgi:hypothetical protein
VSCGPSASSSLLKVERGAEVAGRNQCAAKRSNILLSWIVYGTQPLTSTHREGMDRRPIRWSLFLIFWRPSQRHFELQIDPHIPSVTIAFIRDNRVSEIWMKQAAAMSSQLDIPNRCISGDQCLQMPAGLLSPSKSHSV